jgi:pimeloyl-ACP methyl ester carboxylesterase
MRPSRHKTKIAGALALLLSSTAFSAQRTPPEPEKLQTPAGITEVGVLAGTQYRIDMPNDWNHSLVVYYHGYAMQGVQFHVADKLGPRQQPFLQRHYAVIQSAYSESGWAVQQAYPETEALRKYFVKTYGIPRETYIAGDSMGGALVMITMELNPKPYNGALDLCGAVGPTFESFERRFAMRAAFDYYFPGLMGPLVPVPENYEATQAVRNKISDALKSHPNEASQLREMLGLHTDLGVADDVAYYTFVIGDIQRRAGGNPFDNRNWLYSGTSDTSSQSDYALNDGVRRYAAETRPKNYLYEHYTPTGHLTKPMLALHTLYDPKVQPTSLILYDHIVQLAGFEQNYVQQYVHREGHCAISQEEEGHAFDELREWTRHGVRPIPGALDAKPVGTPVVNPSGKPTVVVAPKDVKAGVPKKQ